MASHGLNVRCKKTNRATQRTNRVIASHGITTSRRLLQLYTRRGMWYVQCQCSSYIYMRVAHRTPDSERTSCPVGASCGEAGSEVGSIDGLPDAGRGLRLCAVRGGLCARCCAVLSTCVAMSRCGEVGSSG